ncbi:sugar kinase [Myxococcota bacterium]|nr:sugar kinase [Myxococcota bacterium]MBU1380402.1 sugar kinase [Myxococcota bacterium]MBU1498317.1 sugar kinase [Myxococcota bacterium]
MSLTIVGSVAFDDVETRYGKVIKILGGSASYSGVIASTFTSVNIVAVVGDDFPKEHVEMFKNRGIDTRGLKYADGKTFYWKGVYADDFSTRTTLETQLNVFADFNPEIPPEYAGCDFLFLANIHPALQLKVLDSMKGKPFVGGDTMNLWISTELDLLKKVISRLDLITVNDEEIRQLTGEFNLVKAGLALQAMGPQTVILKKGEHGAILFAKEDMFYVPAFPLDSFKDPTGAGDSFAGGFMGYIASQGKTDTETLRKAMLYGTAGASFTVQDFSLEAIKNLTMEMVDSRFNALKKYITV